jgi:hypothetical protein
MRIEIDTKPLFICFALVLFVLVLYTILPKSKANRKISPDSSLDGVQTPSHDLNHLPGTWLSRFTALGPIVAFFRFRKAAYIDKLFEEYGDVVRISPNQVRLIHSSLSITHPVLSSIVDCPSGGL